MAEVKNKFFKSTGYTNYANKAEEYYTHLLNNVFEVVDDIMLTDDVEEYKVVILSSEKNSDSDLGGTRDVTIETSDGVTKSYKSYIIKFLEEPGRNNPTTSLPNPLKQKSKEDFLLTRNFLPRALVEQEAEETPSVSLGATGVAYKKEGVWFLREVSNLSSKGYKQFVEALGTGEDISSFFNQGVFPDSTGSRPVYPNSGNSGVGKPSSDSTNSIQPDNWDTKSGVVLNDSAVSFVNDVKKNAPNIKIVINSAYRSPKAQARAVVTKMKLGDKLSTVYAKSTFKKFVELTGYVDGVPAPNFGEKEINAIANWYETKNPSSHLTGNAVDFRTLHLDDSQLNELQNAIRKTGESPEFESTPQHVHVTIKQSKYTSKNTGTQNVS